MPHLDDYKLELEERRSLQRGDVYRLTIPLEAPQDDSNAMPRRGEVKTHLTNLDHTLTLHDILTRKEGTIMLRLSDFELDLLASLIHEARLERLR